MIAVVDYGAGNLFSVLNALEYLKIPAKLTAEKTELQQADAIILPGVGAFPDAMRMLNATGLTELLREEAQKKPFLGICLGMQMLFETSCEFEITAGLGLIPGEIVKIPDTGLKIPHMGWNQLEFNRKCPLLDGVAENDSAYCDYGVKVPALVWKNQIYGAQFHPEKSGKIGLQMLRNFAAMAQKAK